MACEPKTLVVQASKLLALATGKPRPSAKQDREPVVASDPLRVEVVVVERGEFGRKVSHHVSTPRCPHGHSAKPFTARRSRP